MHSLLPEKRTIDVQIDHNQQIFSGYNYTDDNLNPELSEFILTKAKQTFPLSVKENFVIKIHSDKNILRTAEIARCIHRHFHGAYDAAKREMQDLMRIVLMMFIFGAAALGLYFVEQEFLNNFFLNEILEVASWVFWWEAVDVLFLRRREVRRECIILRRLAFAEVQVCSNLKLGVPEYIN